MEILGKNFRADRLDCINLTYTRKGQPNRSIVQMGEPSQAIAPTDYSDYPDMANFLKWR